MTFIRGFFAVLGPLTAVSFVLEPSLLRISFVVCAYSVTVLPYVVRIALKIGDREPGTSFDVQSEISKSKEVRREARELCKRVVGFGDLVDNYKFCPELPPTSSTWQQWADNRILRELLSFQTIQRLYEDEKSGFRILFDSVAARVNDYRENIKQSRGVGTCKNCGGRGDVAVKSWAETVPCGGCVGGWTLRPTDYHFMRRWEANMGDRFAEADLLPEPRPCERCRGTGTVTIFHEERSPCKTCSGKGRIYLTRTDEEHIRNFAIQEVKKLRNIARRFSYKVYLQQL